MTPSDGAETVVCSKIKLGLLDRSERLAELRVVVALRSELLLGALEFGLGLAHAGFGDLDFLVGHVLPGFGVNALFDQL